MFTQEYWASHHNTRLQYPDAFGIKFPSGTIFPAEACKIKPGQRYKKCLSPDDTTAFMQLSVSKPDARLSAICNAVSSDVSGHL